MSEEYKIQNTIVATTAGLIRAYNLKHVTVPDTRKNEYQPNKLLEGYQSPDAPLNTRSTDYLGTLLGTPVFADLTLMGGQYTNNITGEVVTFPEIKLATVLLTVNFATRIVKTEIQGRDGTVKEYIGQDDAKVTVQGIVTGWNGHYPAYEVNLLNEWRRAPISKSVVSAYLQNLGIKNLVVESFDLPQIAGGYSYQTFSMSCISDAPVELKIQ
jgi:hypothetical protein